MMGKKSMLHFKLEKGQINLTLFILCLVIE